MGNEVIFKIKSAIISAFLVFILSIIPLPLEYGASSASSKKLKIEEDIKGLAYFIRKFTADKSSFVECATHYSINHNYKSESCIESFDIIKETARKAHYFKVDETKDDALFSITISVTETK